MKSLCPHAGVASRSPCFRFAIVGNYAAAGLVYDLLLTADWSNPVESK